MACFKASAIAVFSSLLMFLASAQAQQASVDELIEKLKSNAVSEQVDAANALSELAAGAAPATSALIESLGADDARVRAASVFALATIGPEARPAIDTLVRLLSDSEATVRARAAYAIGQIGATRESTAQALISASLDTDVTVRREVRDALRSLKLPREMTLPMWAQTLNEADPQVVMPALLTLAEIGAEAVPVLKAALKDEQACYWATLVAAEIGADAKDVTPELIGLLSEAQPPECRMQALVALAEIGPGAKMAAQPIQKLLNEEKLESVKFAGVYALSEIDDSDATKNVLAELLESNSVDIAAIAGRGLLRADPTGPNTEAAEKAVIQGLRSDNQGIRQLAVRTLAETIPTDQPASDDVIEAFVSVMADASDDVAMEVVDALADQGKKVIPRLIRGMANEKLRPLAVQVAMRLGPDAQDVVPALVDAMDQVNDQPLLRREIHFALGAIGAAAAPAVPKLVEALQDEIPEVRSSACYALGKIGPSARSAVPALRDLAKVDDEFQRIVSVWALINIVPDNSRLQQLAVPLLIRALSDERTQVRQVMAETLGDIGPAAKAAVPALQEAAKDEDPLVREVAEEAIRKINASK